MKSGALLVNEFFGGTFLTLSTFGTFITFGTLVTYLTLVTFGTFLTLSTFWAFYLFTNTRYCQGVRVSGREAGAAEKRSLRPSTAGRPSAASFTGFEERLAITTTLSPSASRHITRTSSESVLTNEAGAWALRALLQCFSPVRV